MYALSGLNERRSERRIAHIKVPALEFDSLTHRAADGAFIVYRGRLATAQLGFGEVSILGNAATTSSPHDSPTPRPVREVQ